MKTRAYLVLSGVIFTIVCIVQIVRASNQWMIELNGHTLAVWPSWIAAVVTGCMALWGFTASSAHRRTY